MRLALATSLALGLGTPTFAQTLDIGLGSTVFNTTGIGNVTVEYRPTHRQFGSHWTGGWVLGARLLEGGNAWIGAGWGFERGFAQRWHFEASLAAGLYRRGTIDLGHPLEFRTQVGVGYTLRSGAAITLSLEHLSNAGLGTINPGLNTLSLRYRVRL